MPECFHVHSYPEVAAWKNQGYYDPDQAYSPSMFLLSPLHDVHADSLVSRLAHRRHGVKVVRLPDTRLTNLIACKANMKDS